MHGMRVRRAPLGDLSSASATMAWLILLRPRVRSVKVIGTSVITFAA